MTEQLDQGLAELVGADWVWNIIQTFAFIHAARNDDGCLGFTYAIAGYSRCGLCGWEISACDRGEETARGRFGLASLAMIGATFDAINVELVRRETHEVVA